MDMNQADAWPRYYFFLASATAECEAWLRKREQWHEESHWEIGDASTPPQRLTPQGHLG